MAPIQVYTAAPINSSLHSHSRNLSTSSAALRYTPIEELPEHPEAESATPMEAEHSSFSSSSSSSGAESTFLLNAESSELNGQLDPSAIIPLLDPYADRSTPGSPGPERGTHAPWSAAQVGFVHSNSGGYDARPTPSPSRTHRRFASHSVARPPPPASYYGHQRSLTYGPPRSGGGADFVPPVDLSNPPGYKQNHRASFSDRPIELCQSYSARNSPSLSYSHNGGILDNAPVLWRDDDGGVLDAVSETVSDTVDIVSETVTVWAKAAGKRLSLAEEQLRNHFNANGRY